MSKLSIRLPESLHKQVKKLSESEGISIDQFIALAVAEKNAASMTVEYLEERTKRGNRERFDAVLEKIPEAEPGEHDRLQTCAARKGRYE